MPEFENIKKILIFRLCCIGDVTMLTPVINNLHNRFPEAKMNIAASNWIKNLLPYLSHIREALIFDAPYEKNFVSRLVKTVRFILLLRKEKYDMVFLAHRHNYYGLLLKLAGIKLRFGFSETKYVTHPADFDQDIHVVERYLKILSQNGIEAKDSNLTLKRIREKKEILAEYGLDVNKFVIGLFPFGGSNPGTQMDIKRWEYRKYKELIHLLSDKNPGINQIVFEGFLESEKITDEYSKSNVRKITISNDLISACNIFVSCDTGPLYIAEGFGVSTLSIFGPTDATKFSPRSRSGSAIHRVIWKKPYCSPCYTTITAYDVKNKKYWDGKTFICNTGTHECIKSVSVNEVLTVLLDMIKELEIKGS